MSDRIYLEDHTQEVFRLHPEQAEIAREKLVKPNDQVDFEIFGVIRTGLSGDSNSKLVATYDADQIRKNYDTTAAKLTEEKFKTASILLEEIQTQVSVSHGLLNSLIKYYPKSFASESVLERSLQRIAASQRKLQVMGAIIDRSIDQIMNFSQQIPKQTDDEKAFHQTVRDLRRVSGQIPVLSDFLVYFMDLVEKRDEGALTQNIDQIRQKWAAVDQKIIRPSI